MKVYKFGGASVKDAESVKNVANILANEKDRDLVVVISAMGKTTNALEKVWQAYLSADKEVNTYFQTVKDNHYKLMSQLFPESHGIFDLVNDLWVEIDWILEEEPHDDANYLYDQIIAIGELVSTKIVSAYLSENKIANHWLDARDVILTDDRYREATVKWDKVGDLAQMAVLPHLQESKIVITQGFIGSTTENNTTTLGREGSDYSAAIFAYALDAESLSIWKDVPGILTADPKSFENVTLIPRITYREAIEMTYFGAKVIHPKTIKPLQNKHIPLYVKSFQDPQGEGTLISEMDALSMPPIIVLGQNQMLIHISSNDFSFIGEHHLSRIFSLLSKHHVKINMMQNTAISFTVCVQQNEKRIEEFLDEMGTDFSYKIDRDLELITIRHYNQETVDQMKINKLILFEEKIRNTIRMVVREVPVMARKE